jgi:hypothetical protein
VAACVGDQNHYDETLTFDDHVVAGESSEHPLNKVAHRSIVAFLVS